MATSSCTTCCRLSTRADALYFTVSVFATVGFGDIAPVSQAARVVLVRTVANLVVIGLLVRVLTGAVRINRGRRGGGGPAPPTA